nr:hypothetical protein [Nakamurella lactea]
MVGYLTAQIGVAGFGKVGEDAGEDVRAELVDGSAVAECGGEAAGCCVQHGAGEQRLVGREVGAEPSHPVEAGLSAGSPVGQGILRPLFGGAGIGEHQ